MINQGWDARALAGGYNAWRAKYPVVDTEVEATDAATATSRP